MKFKAFSRHLEFGLNITKKLTSFSWKKNGTWGFAHFYLLHGEILGILNVIYQQSRQEIEHFVWNIVKVG